MVIISVSPTLAVAGRVTRTLSVVAAPCSAELMKPSVFASVVIAIVGAGATVSSTAEAVAVVDTLPTKSVSVVLTVSVPPSAGLAKVVS